MRRSRASPLERSPMTGLDPFASLRASHVASGQSCCDYVVIMLSPDPRSMTASRIPASLGLKQQAAQNCCCEKPYRHF